MPTGSNIKTQHKYTTNAKKNKATNKKKLETQIKAQINLKLFFRKHSKSNT